MLELIGARNYGLQETGFRFSWPHIFNFFINFFYYYFEGVRGNSPSQLIFISLLSNMSDKWPYQ